ncbi:capsule assembly Wzi family protein [Persicobacter psychrovividus]|uniref:DUF5723 domain-containing protein n=1 Tax=Persicobacter psychrovividus TaxID=387638 RepID=A0ABM7VGB4_9BACT|nr:hypothetical protein PEPS_22860 [Persicobacter psychrovividus]
MYLEIKCLRFVGLFLALQMVIVHSWAQVDSLSITNTTMLSGSTNKASLFWQQANDFGKFGYFQNNLYTDLNLKYDLVINKELSISSGVEGVGRTGGNDFFVQQLYFKIKYLGLTAVVGREEYSVGVYGDQLSSGGYILGTNASPYNRIALGVYDYRKVPFTFGKLLFKGGLSVGKLEKDNSYGRFLGPSIHDKFFYLKSNVGKVNIHGGIAHFAMYGGEDGNGISPNPSFKSVFFAKSDPSSPIAGDRTNVVGSHNGFVEFGFDVDLSNFSTVLYVQKPIVDRSSKYLFGRNKDYFLGLQVDFKSKEHIINKIKLEFIKSDVQNGMGLPDVVVYDENDRLLTGSTGNGNLLMWGNTKDGDIIREAYPQETAAMNNEELWSWVQNTFNNGHDYGGRGDYYNHSEYNLGYRGRGFGNPFLTTNVQVQAYEENKEEVRNILSENNRVKVLSLGASGQLSRSIGYRVNVAYSLNYGNWDKYALDDFDIIGRFTPNFTPDPNYKYYGGLTQWYTYFESSFQLPKAKEWSFTAGLGYDFGEITNNFGVTLGVKWTGVCHFSRKK